MSAAPALAADHSLPGTGRVARAARAHVCFHCGLPIPAGSHFTARVLGEPRDLCCIGCRAAAEMLEAQGLADWYRRRAGPLGAPAPALAAVRDETASLAAPDVAAAFLADVGGSRARCSTSLLVEGLQCPACVWVIETHLERLPGVCAVRVALPERHVLVELDPLRATPRDVVLRLAEIGFAARPDRPSEAQALERREARTGLIQLGVAGLGAMNVMSYAMGLYVGAFDGIEAGSVALMRWMGLLVATPVVAISGRPFFEGAWRSLRVRRLGMDVPIALAVGGAYLASAWATFAGQGEVYFESVCMFIFFLLVGRQLEQRIRRRASSLARSLSAAQPSIARRVDAEGERVVPAEHLRVGDRFRVRPGEAVAADGCVVEGASAVEEAVLTGEPWPRSIAAGDVVVAGAVNVASPILVEATRVGDDTRAASIARLALRAQSERSPAMRLADRVGSVFVAAVLVVAGANFAVWSLIEPERAVWTTLSVLVATCPCALGLALPAATAAATHALARAGFLVTRAGVLEDLARVETVVFDKTGTLTTGEPTLAALVVKDGRDPQQVLSLARALERDSEHPVARALRRVASEAEATGPSPAFEAVRSVPGHGIEGVRDGRRYRIGRPDWALELRERSPAARRGHALLACEGRALAELELADPVRLGSGEAMADLRERGVSIELLSGDPSDAAPQLAERLGLAIERVGATPEEKLERVRALQSEGRRVAVVGDGVNDAPVLRAADVSIAMGSGCDLSRLNAGAVLLRDDLSLVPRALDAARRMRRIGLENVAWAVGYNVLVLPLAVAGKLPPWLAALGMSASSLVVVLNALRARRVAPADEGGAAA